LTNNKFLFRINIEFIKKGGDFIMAKKKAKKKKKK